MLLGTGTPNADPDRFGPSVAVVVGDASYLVDFAYLLRERDGSVTVEHDRHVEGLFPRDTWLGLLAEAGFAPSRAEYPGEELTGYEVFVGRR